MPRYIPLTPEEQQQFGFGARRPKVQPRNTFFGDLTDAAQAGLAGATADTFEGVNHVTGFGVGPRDYFRGIQQRNLQGITPESQQAMEQTGFEGDTLDALHLNPNASLKGAALHVAQGVGSFAPSLAAGGVLTKGLGVLGKVAPFAGFGAANALMAGGGAAEQARREAYDRPESEWMKDPQYAARMNAAYPAGVYDAPDSHTPGMQTPPLSQRRFAIFDHETGTVERVIDGDTLWTHRDTWFPGGKVTKYRLAEVDTPETFHGDPKSPGQPYGPEAAAELHSMVDGKVIDAKLTGDNTHARDVARINAEGTDVNRELVKRGAGWANRRYLTDPTFLDDEAKAREAKLGLWAQERPQSPWDYRLAGAKNPHAMGNYKRAEFDHVQHLLRDPVAEKAASDAFGPAALLGFATGGLAGPIEAKIVTQGGGLLKKLATGVATEGSQEFVESGGQQMAVNQAMQPIDQRELTKDALPQAVGGAVIGGLTGGAVGGTAGAFHKGYQSLLRTPTPEGENQPGLPNHELGDTVDLPEGGTGTVTGKTTLDGRVTGYSVRRNEGAPEPQDVHDALKVAQEEATATGKSVSLTKDPAAVEVAERNKQEIIAALQRNKTPEASAPASSNSGVTPTQPTTEETQNEAIPQPAVTSPRIAELERSVQAAQPAVAGNRQLLEGAERPQPQPAVAEAGRKVTYGQEAHTDALESRQTSDEARKEEGLLRPTPDVGVQAPTTDGIQVEELQPEAIQVSENPVPPSASAGNPLLRAPAPETTASESPVAPRKGATLPVGNPRNEPETAISVRSPEFYEAKTKAQSLVSKWAKDLGLEAPALSDQHPSKLDAHGHYAEDGIRIGDKAARGLVSKDPHEFVRAVETVAHEFGHHVAETHLVVAPETTRAEVEKDYQAWVASPEYKTFAEKMKSRRPAAAAAKIQDTGREFTRAQQDYVVRKNEWLADNVARYLMKQEFNGPVSPETEGFIAQVAKAIKTLYTKLKADLNIYKAAPSLEKFLDGMRIDRMVRENGVEDVTIEAPEEAPQGLEPESLDRIRDYEIARETSRQSPDLGRPTSEEGDGEAGEVEQRIAHPTVMWVHNNHNTTVYSEDAPKGAQTFDAAGGQPNDAAAKRLVQYAHFGEGQGHVEKAPTGWVVTDGNGHAGYKVTGHTNADGERVWVAHRRDQTTHSAYEGERTYELIELSPGKVGLRETITPTSIEGSVDKFSPEFILMRVQRAIKSARRIPKVVTEKTKSRQSPTEALTFLVPKSINQFRSLVAEGKAGQAALLQTEEKRLDLMELTKLGEDLDQSESPATDSVMRARDAFLHALGLLQSEFGIKPADGKIPRTAIIWKEGGQETTWGDVENIGQRMKDAEAALVREKDSDPEYQARGRDTLEAQGNLKKLYRASPAQARKTLKGFGLDMSESERSGIPKRSKYPNLNKSGKARIERDINAEARRLVRLRKEADEGVASTILAEPSGEELLAAGGGETEQFASQGDPEGASRNTVEDGAKNESAEATRPVKPQTSHTKLSITSIVEGSKTIPKQLVTLVDDIALRILGINTAVEVADEHGVDSVLQKYGSDLDVVEKELAAETKVRRKEELQHKVNLLKDAIARIEEAKESGESHFIALDRFNAPSERRHLVFLPKGERGSEQRVTELMHELGHYIQRNAVDQLIREVKKAEEENAVTGNVAKKQQLLRNLFGVESAKQLKDMTRDEWFEAAESFARNMEMWAMSNEAPKNTVERFFKSMGDKLRALWETFAAKFGKVAKDPQYKQFDAFMEGLIGARKGVEPKTALGKRYRDALQDIQVSARPAKRGETLAQPYTGFDKLSAVARGEKIVKAREKTIGFLNDFARLWRTPIAELKSYGPRMTEVARKFRVMPGEKAIGQTIHEQIQLHSAPFYAELHDLLSNLTGKQFLKSAEGKARYKQVAEALIAQTPDAEIKKQGLWEAELVRDYLEKLYRKLTGMGLEIGHRRDYFPLVIDRGKWNEDRHDVIDILKTQLQKEWRRKGQKVTDEEAETYAEALHQKIGMTDGVLFSMADKATENSQVWESVFGPNFRFRNERVMTDEMHKALKDYYVNDLGLILNMYTHSGFKRAVFQKEFGGRDFDGKFDPAWKLNRALIEATRGRSPEMTKTQMDRVVRVLFPALMGTLGQKEITPGWRAAQSWLQLGLNIGLLPLSLLSNIVELGQIDIRAGKYGMKDLLTGRNLVAMRKIFGLMKDRKEYGKLKNLATTIGTIRDDLTEHVLSNSMEAAYQIPITHKISEKYFRMIGMKWFSDFERIVAIGVAKDMLKEYAADPARYRKDLDELGVTPEQITNWFGATEDMTDNISAHGNVLNALNRWVDSALLRPNATIRPAYGSDPRFALVWHLKDFMWGFHEVILRRVWEQSKSQPHVMKALPWLMLGAAILPLAFVGSELRKKITRDVPSALLGVHVPEEPMSDGDYFLRLVDRAGILGPMQIFLDMEDASSHGRFALLSAMGPTLDKFQEFMLHDLDPIYTLSHTLPGFAQSRVLRDAVFGR